MFLRKLANRIRQAVQKPMVVACHYPRLIGNADFNLRNVIVGLATRPMAPPKKEVIERVIDAYNKAKEKQKTVERKFLVGNEWHPIFEHNMGSIMAALRSRQINLVSRRYSNFMRDELSTGLHGMPVDMQKAYFSRRPSKLNQLLFLIDGLYRFNLWRKLLPTTSTTELAAPSIGNPYGLIIDGTFIRDGAGYQHYYAKTTLSHLEGIDRPVVAELGGGYGGYAYFLQSLSRGKVRYLDIDLPEILALASFYLMHCFPNKRFHLYGESTDIHTRLLEYDFILLPNFEIENIPQQSVDLAFNSYSLAEMSGDAIEAYVDSFGRICRTTVFHVNHTRHAEIGADSFGLEKAGFHLKSRRKALWNLGRNLAMDEFEFLYKRPIHGE